MNVTVATELLYYFYIKKQLKYLNKKNLLLFIIFLQTKNEVCLEDKFHINFFSFTLLVHLLCQQWVFQCYHILFLSLKF